MITTLQPVRNGSLRNAGNRKTLSKAAYFFYISCLLLLFTSLSPLASVSLAAAHTVKGNEMTEAAALKQKELAPVPEIRLIYGENGDYCPRETWTGAFQIDNVDVFARAMLAEENEKLYDPRRVEDLIGAGWVMKNRTRAKDFLYYAKGDDALLDVILGGGQFALGGVIVDGKRLPGNAAIVANPEAYPAWFGDDPRGRYWKAYEIAGKILDNKLSDPTHGALYFVDAHYTMDGRLLPYPDGRTRFNIVYSPLGNYSIPELRLMYETGQEFWGTSTGD